MTYNLSLLLRKQFGVGTPKQALAGAQRAFLLALGRLWRLILVVLRPNRSTWHYLRESFLAQPHSTRLGAV